MTNIFWKSYVTLLFSTSLAWGYTPTRGHIHATGGIFVYKTDVPESNYFDFQSGSPSLTILGDVNDSGSLEISIGYLNKHYMIRDNGLTLIEETPIVLAGFGYRHWLNSRASVSGLIYTAYPTKTAVVRENDFSVLRKTTAHRNTENGIELRAQYEILGNDVWGVSLEGRYAYAISRESREFLNQYGFFIGLRHLIQQSKAPEPLYSR